MRWNDGHGGWVTTVSIKINCSTLPIAELSFIQYGRALDRLLWEVVFENPALGPVYIIKADVSSGLYCIGLCPGDALKIGLIFPVYDKEKLWSPYP